jgi:hypothetical protein
MRVTFLFLVLSLGCAPAAAQLHKCLDDKKQVTYSNIPCDKQGLKSGGTVTQDRVTSMPFTEPPKAAAPGAGPARKDKEPAKALTPREREEAETGRGSLQIKPNLPQSR